MSCQEFWEQDRDTSSHLSECPSCAARHERHEGLRRALRRLNAEWRPSEARPSVERRLLAAFRAQASLGAPAIRGRWIPVIAWGAALAATVLAGVLLIRPHEPQRTRHGSSSSAELAMAEAPNSVNGLEDGYGDFIPLPNTETLSPNEAVNVVRLAMPRSVMIPLGYAVSEEQASETVEADVMLGADGVARAVRFVTDSDY